MDKWLIGLCQLNNQYILATCWDGNLKEFDLLSNTFVTSFKGNNIENNIEDNPLFTVKKFEIGGKMFLVSHSKKGIIQLWENEQ